MSEAVSCPFPVQREWDPRGQFHSSIASIPL